MCTRCRGLPCKDIEVENWLMNDWESFYLKQSTNVHLWNFVQKGEVLFNSLTSNECF